MRRARTIAAAALTASIALHVGTGGGLVYLSQNRVEQGGGDTPMEVSLDPSAASGGSGPPIDAGPSGAPPQVAETPPQQTVKASEPPKENAKEPPTQDKPQEEKPEEAKPQEAKPQEDRPQEDRPQEDRPQETKPQETKPPEEPPPKETVPSATNEPPPPVIKSAPDADTPDVVASEPPPPPPPKPEEKKPEPPKPKPPPPQQAATAAGPAGGAPATGRERTRNVGTAIDPGAQLSCARAIRARLRKPLGLTPRPFKVQIIVAASGAIIAVRPLTSSGSPLADQEAVRAFRSSGPFPPCPRVGPSISLEVPVINGRR